MESVTERYRSRLYLLAGGTLLMVHANLLAWSSYIHSPTPDEIAYLPAGIAHWRFDRFELVRANPPLVRMVAALPVLAVGCETEWSEYDGAPGSRPDHRLGKTFLTVNGARSFWLFAMARWACIPLVLVGGVICWIWAYELYGRAAGLTALALWCFCPNVLGNGALITPDAATTSLGISATYAFWRWLRNPSWATAYLAGLVLGFAELVKSNWLVLFPLWFILCLVWHYSARREVSGATYFRRWSQLAAIVAIAGLVINLGYGFDGTWKRLGRFQFLSRTLRGDDVLVDTGHVILGNRFRDSWLSSLPVPLPEQYIVGIDVQKEGAEGGGRAYLFGVWKYRGWWYYYLAAATVKVPLGIWIMIGLAIGTRIAGMRFGPTWRDEVVLLAPAIATLIFISSQNGINRHFRYALPIFPFLFVWISSLAQLWTKGPKATAWVATGAWIWAIISSLLVYPHSLSYFNEIAGGPAGGPRFLLGSNTDWGQDLLFLKKWIDVHPNARPLSVGWHMTYLDIKLADIDCPQPPASSAPGWHIISVNDVFSYEPKYQYFQGFRPIGSVGYSMNIYHLTKEDISRWESNHQGHEPPR